MKHILATTQRLVQQRHAEESAARQALAEAQSLVADIEAEVNSIRQSLHAQARAARQALHAGAAVGWAGRSPGEAMTDIAGREERLDRALETMARRREHLLDAVRARKAAAVLDEKLKARQAAQTQRAAARAEHDLHLTRLAQGQAKPPHSLL